VGYGKERLAVRLHEVQYNACRERRCPRKGFTEASHELPAGARLTRRLRPQVVNLTAIGLGQPVSVAAAGLISWPIAHAGFITHADALLAERQPLDGGVAGDGDDVAGEVASLAVPLPHE